MFNAKKDIEGFVEGYAKFREQYFEADNTTFAKLVSQGQNPKALMIACSDSRVDPALVMNCQPGDLFVIRNVANLIPPFEDDHHYHGTSAALEFGVCVLEIPHIIVFGHTQCGGIRSLLERSNEKCPPTGFLNKWMELAKPAYNAVENYHQHDSLDEKTVLCGKYSLINSYKNLLTFPWIAERVRNQRLFLHAWNFDIVQGVLEEYNEAENQFIKVHT